MLITGILVFLLLSALFSGSEIAFISASKLGIELKRAEGLRRGRILASFYDKPDKFLGAMLIGNNIALVIYTYLMTRLLSPLIEPLTLSDSLNLLIITIITTAVVLLFGEFLPKTIFRIFSNQILYTLTFFLAFIRWLLAIPVHFTIGLSNLIIKYVLRSPVEKEEQTFTQSDLEHFISGTVEDENEEMDTEIFRNVLHLKNLKVRNCMVPRTELRHIDHKATIDELKKEFIDSNHSRLLVSEDGVDNVRGYVHHQQIFSNPASIEEIMMDISFVPETMNIQNLLLDFKRNHFNIACVVDEYGGTSGLITMEDMLEEIFGEIEDEHDTEELIERKISETEYLLSGRLEIDYLNATYDLHIPEGDFETLSGYLVMTLGNIPEKGEIIELGSHRFMVEAMSDTKIEVLRLTLIAPED